MRVTLTDSEAEVLKARMKSDIQQLKDMECTAKLANIISSAILTREKILAKLEGLEISNVSKRGQDVIDILKKKE